MSKKAKQVGKNDEQVKAEIVAALEKHHPASLTELWRLMAGEDKKLDGRMAKRLRIVLPGIEELLKKNVPLKEDKPTKAPKSKSAKTKPIKAPKSKSDKKWSIEIPEVCPYRPSSSYAAVFAVLYEHRQSGITRAELLQKVMKITGKPERNCHFDISVVTSPSQDGSAHKSANRAADKYWTDKGEGGSLKLHVR